MYVTNYSKLYLHKLTSSAAVNLETETLAAALRTIKPHVLVVDDNRVNLVVCKQILQKAGCRVRNRIHNRNNHSHNRFSQAQPQPLPPCDTTTTASTNTTTTTATTTVRAKSQTHNHANDKCDHKCDHKHNNNHKHNPQQPLA